MLDEYKRVTLKGHEDQGVLIFMDDGDGTGALTTEEEFQRFVPGYAHVFSDGIIRRYNKEIGTRDDLIEVIEQETSSNADLKKERNYE